MSEKKENIDGIEYYGFEDSDLFPGTKTDADKPIPNIEFGNTNVDDKKENQPKVETTFENEKKESKSFFTNEDIEEIIKTNKNNNPVLGGEKVKPVSNVIKKNEASSKGVLTPLEFQKKMSESIGLNSEDWAEIAREIEDSDILNDDFLDFVELPRISGDEKNFVGKNLISSDHVKSSQKRVEISDEPQLFDDSHSTSMEINRLENGDIESISIYCKCGEITKIKFNYQDNFAQIAPEYFKSEGSIRNMEFEEVKIKKNEK